MLKIEALSAFNDNYIWLLQDSNARCCAVVDPGDAGPVLEWLRAHPGWRLSDILITHHHRDHVGGVETLKRLTGARVAGPAHEHIPGRDVALEEGATLIVLDHAFIAMEVPGHTLGHIAYYHHDRSASWLFSGDTLFAGGCGRLFEGTPRQMFDALKRLAALPASTYLYCAHEYTLSNLRFAQAVEPDNPDIAERLRQVVEQRHAGRITLPSTLHQELATNPFLRCGEAATRTAAERLGAPSCADPATIFTLLRAWKNDFAG